MGSLPDERHEDKLREMQERHRDQYGAATDAGADNIERLQLLHHQYGELLAVLAVAEATIERQREALEEIAKPDALVNANEAAFSVYAFRHIQAVAREALLWVGNSDLP